MSAAQKIVSIIVPVYFNAESLPELHERICTLEQSLLQRGVGMELIMVDDGSRDNSYEAMCAIRNQRPETRLIRLTRNFGEQAAASVGFTHATGDCVTVLSADLQEPPEQIALMVDMWLRGEKLVFSHRRSRKDPLLSRFFAGVHYWLLSALVVKNYPEGGVGMLLMDKSLLHYVTSLGANVNYALYLFMLGFEAVVLPYDREARKHGKSRWTFKRKFFYFVDTVTGFSVTPLRVVAGTGLVAAFASFAYGLCAIVRGLWQGTDLPAYVILVALLGFFFGIVLLLLSIIGEYLWRIFAMLSRHPKSVVLQSLMGPNQR